MFQFLNIIIDEIKVWFKNFYVKHFGQLDTSNTIKGTIIACVRPCVRHTSLQNDVYGGVEPWWLKGKPLVTKWKGQKYIHKKYFCQKYFHQKYFHQKYFHQKYFWKNIQIILKKKCFVKNISEKIFHHKYFRKKYFHKKYFHQKYFHQKFFCQKYFWKNIQIIF